MVTAYDFESGCPGSSPKLGPIYYKALITAQGSPEPSSLWGSTLGYRSCWNKKGWGHASWLMVAACSVFGPTVFSGIGWHMPQKIKSTLSRPGSRLGEVDSNFQSDGEVESSRIHSIASFPERNWFLGQVDFFWNHKILGINALPNAMTYSTKLLFLFSMIFGW